jgi:hypothetical protein
MIPRPPPNGQQESEMTIAIATPKARADTQRDEERPFPHFYARTFTLPDGRQAFRQPQSGTVLVFCDGTWTCPRRERNATDADREHLLDLYE